MKIVYHETDDILHIQLSDDPIVRDESHGWHVNLGFSSSCLAEITVLNLHELLASTPAGPTPLGPADALPQLNAVGTKSDLYEADFYRWTEEQAEVLRTGRLSELDVENLLEEVQALGRSEKRGLRSQLEQIIGHLLHLSLSAQSDEDSRRRKDAVIRLRTEFARDVADNASLQHVVPDLFAQAWPAAATSFNVSRTRTVRAPEQCPFTLEEVLDDDFWPLTARAKTTSFADLAGSVKSSVRGVSIEDMCPWRDRQPEAHQREAAKRLANLGGSEPGITGAPRRHRGSIDKRDGMTVSELITLLQRADPNAKVLFLGEYASRTNIRFHSES